jgi:uncharacterized protein YndB with AHSA1/START domain
MKPEQVYEVWIRTSPEKIWTAITDGDWTHRYFHQTRIESDWQVGSPVVMWMDDGRKAIDGTILECSPPRRLSFTWGVRYHEEAAKEEASRVTFEIGEFGDMSRLRVVHDRFPEGSIVAPAVAGVGWMSILSNLKTLLETGEPMPIS